MTRPFKLFFFGALGLLLILKAAGAREQQQPTRTPPGRARAVFVSAVAFSRDGRWLASRRFQSGDIDVWDVTSGRLVRTLPDGGKQSGALAVSPDGKVLASGQGTKVKLWETTTGRQISDINVGASELAYSPDGRWLAAATSEGVQLWDASTFQLSRSLSFPVGIFGSKIAFSPEGRLLAAGAKSTIKIWETVSGREARTITRVEPPPMPEHIVSIGGISSLCFSPDGRRVAAGGGSREVRTWDVSTGRELQQFSLNAINADVIGFSPDGRTMVTQEVFLGREGIAPVITVWDAAGNKVGHIPVEHAMTRAVSVMPNANRVAVGSEKGVQIWDIEERKLLTTLIASGD
jgi:WD40 repeat protein